VRIYHLGEARRPVVDIERITPSPIISVLLTPPSLDSNKSHSHLPHLIVSTTDGITVLYSIIEKRSVGQYNASGGGSILATHVAKLKSGATDQQDDKSTFVLAGVGANRYLHVWDLESRKVLSKIWLKTRGTGVGILPSHAGLVEDDMIIAAPKEKKSSKTSKSGENENRDDGEDAEEDDMDVWDDMEDANKVVPDDESQGSDDSVAEKQTASTKVKPTKKRSEGASDKGQRSKRLKS